MADDECTWNGILKSFDEFDDAEATQDDREEEWSENDAFVKWYLFTKPRGNRESWNEDIGVPTFVLHQLWEESGSLAAGFFPKHHLFFGR